MLQMPTQSFVSLLHTIYFLSARLHRWMQYKWPARGVPRCRGHRKSGLKSNFWRFWRVSCIMCIKDSRNRYSSLPRRYRIVLLTTSNRSADYAKYCENKSSTSTWLFLSSLGFQPWQTGFFLFPSFFLKSAKDWAVKLGRKRLNLADKKTANSVS